MPSKEEVGMSGVSGDVWEATMGNTHWAHECMEYYEPFSIDRLPIGMSDGLGPLGAIKDAIDEHL